MASTSTGRRVLSVDIGVKTTCAVLLDAGPSRPDGWTVLDFRVNMGPAEGAKATTYDVGAEVARQVTAMAREGEATEVVVEQQNRNNPNAFTIAGIVLYACARDLPGVRYRSIGATAKDAVFKEHASAGGKGRKAQSVRCAVRILEARAEAEGAEVWDVEKRLLAWLSRGGIPKKDDLADAFVQGLAAIAPKKTRKRKAKAQATPAETED